MDTKFVVYDCDGGGFGAHLYSLFQYYAIANYCNAELYCVNPLITTYLDCSSIAITSIDPRMLNGKAIRLKTLMDTCRDMDELVESIHINNYEIVLCGYHHYHKFFTRNSKDILGGSRKIAHRSFLHKIRLKIQNIVTQAEEQKVISRETVEEYRKIKQLAKKRGGTVTIHLRTLKDSAVGRILYLRSRNKIWKEFRKLSEQYLESSVYLLSDDASERFNFERYLNQKTFHIRGKGLEWHSSLKILYGVNLLMVNRSIEVEKDLISIQSNEDQKRLYKFLLPMMEWDLMTDTSVMISTGSCYSTTAYLMSESNIAHIRPYSTYQKEYRSEELF